jgi:hypothetical protein
MKAGTVRIAPQSAQIQSDSFAALNWLKAYQADRPRHLASNAMSRLQFVRDPARATWRRDERMRELRCYR